MLKLDEPFRNQEIFIISFLTVQIWVQRVKKIFCSFWLIFCPMNPDPWIRIFFPDPGRQNRLVNKFLKILNFTSYKILIFTVSS